MQISTPAEDRKLNFLSKTFYTLRHRDFRLFWIALTISLLGVSFQNVAQGWIVYRLTGSATMLGLAGFIPVLFAAPASLTGGLLADRVSRRNLVIVTQSLMIIPPVVIAVLIWSQSVQVWHIIGATSALAIIAAVDLPARTSMVPDLVPEKDLLNAQGLTSAVGQVTRILGPTMAGVMIAWWGESVPFLINGLTYLAMVVALAMMSPQPVATRQRSRPGDFLEGILYTLKTPVVLGLFFFAAAQGIFMSSYNTLLPLYATDILNVGAEGLGGLTAAIGAGALIGALGVANLREGKRGNILYLISIFIPVVLVGFAWSGIFILSMPILFLLGLGTVVIRTITATYLLTIVPEYVRGRVISLATLIYFGVPYVAGLPIGYLAEHIPAPVVVSLTAGLFFVITIAVSLMIPKVRRLA